MATLIIPKERATGFDGDFSVPCNCMGFPKPLRHSLAGVCVWETN